MSKTDPQAAAAPGTARRDLVDAWYDDPTQVAEPVVVDRPVPAPARSAGRTADDGSVEDVARRVVKRLLDTEQAMLRHLEAIEAEAERRTDLLLAQAELDAELIRLNARREAHRIALAGSGAAVAPPTGSHAADQRSLDELTDSLARFADEVDALHPTDTTAAHRAGLR